MQGDIFSPLCFILALQSIFVQPHGDRDSSDSFWATPKCQASIPHFSARAIHWCKGRHAQTETGISARRLGTASRVRKMRLTRTGPKIRVLTCRALSLALSVVGESTVRSAKPRVMTSLKCNVLVK